MKVLVTGMHHASIQPETKRRGVQAAVGAYVRAMEDLPHLEVEVRPPRMNEDVRDYDVIIIGITPLMAIVSNWLVPAVDLFKHCYEERDSVKTILAIDDWKTPGPFMNSVATLVKLDHIIRKPFHDGKPEIQWARDNQDEWNNGLRAILSAREDPWFESVFCTHDFGDPAAREAMGELLPGLSHMMDPTPYVVQDFGSADITAHRERRWLMSALADHSKWVGGLEHEWPVDYYCSTKVKNAEMANTQVLPPIRQNEMWKLYEENWGALLVPYRRIIGAGWWRDRWFAVPNMGAVLYPDLRDIGKLSPQNFGRPMSEIEEMTDVELSLLSASQRAEINDWSWTKQQLREAIVGML
jgi:hypothetical protein